MMAAATTAGFVVVPTGWERDVLNGRVTYKSPSLKALTNREELLVYLTSDGTCKCGLRCPFQLEEQFSFDPHVLGLPDNGVLTLLQTNCKVGHLNPPSGSSAISSSVTFSGSIGGEGGGGGGGGGVARLDSLSDKSRSSQRSGGRAHLSHHQGVNVNNEASSSLFVQSLGTRWVSSITDTVPSFISKTDEKVGEVRETMCRGDNSQGVRQRQSPPNTVHHPELSVRGLLSQTSNTVDSSSSSSFSPSTTDKTDGHKLPEEEEKQTMPKVMTLKLLKSQLKDEGKKSSDAAISPELTAVLRGCSVDEEEKKAESVCKIGGGEMKQTIGGGGGAGGGVFTVSIKLDEKASESKDGDNSNVPESESENQSMSLRRIEPQQIPGASLSDSMSESVAMDETTIATSGDHCGPTNSCQSTSTSSSSAPPPPLNLSFSSDPQSPPRPISSQVAAQSAVVTQDSIQVPMATTEDREQTAANDESACQACHLSPPPQSFSSQTKELLSVPSQSETKTESLSLSNTTTQLSMFNPGLPTPTLLGDGPSFNHGENLMVSESVGIGQISFGSGYPSTQERKPLIISDSASLVRAPLRRSQEVRGQMVEPFTKPNSLVVDAVETSHSGGVGEEHSISQVSIGTSIEVGSQSLLEEVTMATVPINAHRGKELNRSDSGVGLDCEWIQNMTDVATTMENIGRSLATSVGGDGSAIQAGCGQSQNGGVAMDLSDIVPLEFGVKTENEVYPENMSTLQLQTFLPRSRESLTLLTSCPPKLAPPTDTPTVGFSVIDDEGSPPFSDLSSLTPDSAQRLVPSSDTHSLFSSSSPVASPDPLPPVTQHIQRWNPQLMERTMRECRVSLQPLRREWAPPGKRPGSSPSPSKSVSPKEKELKDDQEEEELVDNQACTSVEVVDFQPEIQNLSSEVATSPEVSATVDDETQIDSGSSNPTIAQPEFPDSKITGVIKEDEANEEPSTDTIVLIQDAIDDLSGGYLITASEEESDINVETASLSEVSFAIPSTSDPPAPPPIPLTEEKADVESSSSNELTLLHIADDTKSEMVLSSTSQSLESEKPEEELLKQHVVMNLESSPKETSFPPLPPYPPPSPPPLPPAPDSDRGEIQMVSIATSTEGIATTMAERSQEEAARNVKESSVHEICLESGEAGDVGGEEDERGRREEGVGGREVKLNKKEEEEEEEEGKVVEMEEDKFGWLHILAQVAVESSNSKFSSSEDKQETSNEKVVQAQEPREEAPEDSHTPLPHPPQVTGKSRRAWRKKKTSLESDSEGLEPVSGAGGIGIGRGGAGGGGGGRRLKVMKTGREGGGTAKEGSVPIAKAQLQQKTNSSQNTDSSTGCEKKPDNTSFLNLKLSADDSIIMKMKDASNTNIQKEITSSLGIEPQGHTGQEGEEEATAGKPLNVPKVATTKESVKEEASQPQIEPQECINSSFTTPEDVKVAAAAVPIAVEMCSEITEIPAKPQFCSHTNQPQIFDSSLLVSTTADEANVEQGSAELADIQLMTQSTALPPPSSSSSSVETSGSHDSVDRSCDIESHDTKRSCDSSQNDSRSCDNDGRSCDAESCDINSNSSTTRSHDSRRKRLYNDDDGSDVEGETFEDRKRAKKEVKRGRRKWRGKHKPTQGDMESRPGSMEPGQSSMEQEPGQSSVQLDQICDRDLKSCERTGPVENVEVTNTTGTDTKDLVLPLTQIADPQQYPPNLISSPKSTIASAQPPTSPLTPPPPPPPLLPSPLSSPLLPSSNMSDADDRLIVSIPLSLVELSHHQFMECYSASHFSPGAVVWAKAAHLPGWPGVVINHTEWKSTSLKPAPLGKRWIKWYGDDTVSLVGEKSMKPLSEGLRRRVQRKTTKDLQKAIKLALRAQKKKEEEQLQKKSEQNEVEI